MDKFDLLKDIFSALEINVKERSDVINIILKQDTLKSKTLITDLNTKVPNLKSYYNSSKLTCLHKNSLDKQKFPAVNMFRQILKCNSFKMEPYVISKGYDKFSGKKIVERFYRIKDISDIDDLKEEIKYEINENNSTNQNMENENNSYIQNNTDNQNIVTENNNYIQTINDNEALNNQEINLISFS